MTIDPKTMYWVHLEARIHSKDDKPIGKIIELEPEAFPAQTDDEAVKEACHLAEVNEHLKSLRLTNGGSHKKFLVRVKMVKKALDGKEIFSPRYKNERFNETQNSKTQIV